VKWERPSAATLSEVRLTWVCVSNRMAHAPQPATRPGGEIAARQADSVVK